MRGSNGNGPRPAGVRKNRMLGLMPPKELACLQKGLEQVALRSGDVIAEAGQPYSHVYFPDDCVVSLVNEAEGGTKVEVGTVGCEGMAGIPVILGGTSSPSRVFVQVAGNAQRIPVGRFKKILAECPELDALLRRYVLAYLAQVGQTVLCNRVHQIDQRCARWLLLTDDRVEPGMPFGLTHLYLSWMLGVRRPGVSEAAGNLQRSGLISYSRGKIRVLDRAGLEKKSCNCYGMVRAEFESLLSAPVG